MLYNMGLYNKLAFEVVMAHFGAGLSGKRSSAKYIDKSFLQIQEENKPLTEDEKQRQVDLFFAKENARRVNWKRNHHKNNVGKVDLQK